jgi:hypothetical protein
VEQKYRSRDLTTFRFGFLSHIYRMHLAYVSISKVTGGQKIQGDVVNSRPWGQGIRVHRTSLFYVPEKTAAHTGEANVRLQGIVERHFAQK